MNIIDLRLRREDKSSAKAIIFHPVLHVSFLPILPQYERLNQTTNNSVDLISIAYYFMATFESQAPGRGYSQKNWVGVCGPLPKTQKFDVLFMTFNVAAAGTVVLNIIYDGLWLTILSIVMKK